MISLQLIDVSPAENPDTLTFLAKFSANYGVNGVGDPLNLAPYSAGNNPLGFTNPNQIPTPELPFAYTQAPTVEAEDLGGFYVNPHPLIMPAPIEGVAQGIAPVNGFALRMYAPGGVELPTGTSYAASGAGTQAAFLGAAGNYALLASAGITNTGNTTVVGGNIGSVPTSSITGFPPGLLTAPAVIDNSANATAAQVALAAAIAHYQGLTPTLSGLANLSTGGNGSTIATWTPGVYVGAAGLTMPTGIILDAQGNPNATFIFIAGSTINLASGQTISLANGAQAQNVVFVAGSAFTSVATSTVNGNILAVSGITLGGGTLNGRALVTTGPVTISAATAITASPNVSALTGPSSAIQLAITLPHNQ
jgi:hypothetical protein